MEQFINNDFKKRNLTTLLNPNCELVKYVGVDAVQIIFDILYWKIDPLYPDMKMIALNESAIPIYNEQIYKINILTIYQLFSFVNLDNCILSTDNNTKWEKTKNESCVFFPSVFVMEYFHGIPYETIPHIYSFFSSFHLYSLSL